MLYAMLFVAGAPQAKPTPGPVPARKSVPCRDKNGKISIHCFPQGTVVKMNSERMRSKRPKAAPLHDKRGVMADAR